MGRRHRPFRIWIFLFRRDQGAISSRPEAGHVLEQAGLAPCPLPLARRGDAGRRPGLAVPGHCRRPAGAHALQVGRWNSSRSAALTGTHRTAFHQSGAGFCGCAVLPESPKCSPSGGTPLKVIWPFPSSPGSPGLSWENVGWLSVSRGDAMPDDNAHEADDMRKLRARFPRWGILFDSLESIWVAVRGQRTLVAASSPEKLTQQVEAAARGEAGPDEGDKTQTWRALRKHGRG